MPEDSQNVNVQAQDSQRHMGTVTSPFEQDGSLYRVLTQKVLRSDLASCGLTRATGSLRGGEAGIALG